MVLGVKTPEKVELKRPVDHTAYVKMEIYVDNREHLAKVEINIMGAQLNIVKLTIKLVVAVVSMVAVVQDILVLVAVHLISAIQDYLINQCIVMNVLNQVIILLKPLQLNVIMEPQHQIVLKKEMVMLK